MTQRKESTFRNWIISIPIPLAGYDKLDPHIEHFTIPISIPIPLAGYDAIHTGLGFDLWLFQSPYPSRGMTTIFSFADYIKRISIPIPLAGYDLLNTPFYD